MTAEKATMALGRRVYGLGVSVGMVCLAWGDFRTWGSWCQGLSDRTTLAYAARLPSCSSRVPPSSGSDRAWGRRARSRLLRASLSHPDGCRVVLTHSPNLRAQRHRRATRDYGGWADRLTRHAKIACGPGRTPHRLGQLAFGFVRC